MTELEHLEQAIAALEAQRSLLGDAVVDTGLGTICTGHGIYTTPMGHCAVGHYRFSALYRCRAADHAVCALAVYRYNGEKLLSTEMNCI